MSPARKLDRPTALGGRYRLVRVRGSGGMGTVWEAEDEILGRPVAVKILAEHMARSERSLRQFEREARAAARLSGPHIAAVYDFGEDGDVPYLVMELIEGETLADRLAREGRIPPDQASWIAADIADALESAHREGVVHRDVKPANVMLVPEGGVKVMDFGIAAAAWAETLTGSASAMGTPSYLAPEQARGEPATSATDVYALGAVLYEMLAGRPPFVRETPVATAVAHVRDEPIPIAEVAPDVPPGVAATCDAALQKDPAKRPQSAAAMASALRTATAVLPAVQDAAAEETVPLSPVAPPDGARGSARSSARSSDPSAEMGPRARAARREPSLRVVLVGLALLVAIPLVLYLASSPLPKELRHPATLRQHAISRQSSPTASPVVSSAASSPPPTYEHSSGDGNGHGGSPPHGNGQGNGPDGDEG